MRIAIVGGGPAGLKAAEVAVAAGAQVVVYEAKASVGRKLLVAGRGGLNITKSEPLEKFTSHYLGVNTTSHWWDSLIGEFTPDQLREWAAGLGIETFAASTGRVYPREMKAAPLLRRWVHRLKESGVTFAMHHRWTGLARRENLELSFDTSSGLRQVTADAAILALGGASWPQTGSDGKWMPAFEALGLSTAPLQPANCGWAVAWAAGMQTAEGLPIKNIRAYAQGQAAIGELLITSYGLEGGALYQLGAVLRSMAQPVIEIDFKPDLTIERLIAKMGPAKRNLLKEAEQRWKLPPSVIAILAHHPNRDLWNTPTTLASAIKRCPVTLLRPRPIEEAISSAGGVCWSELDENLMIRKIPGVFLAGEMIDWEAPTGGYLMQGCFAMGTRAGQQATAWLRGA